MNLYLDSTFLAPPAAWQRSFSNADSSVVRRRRVNFSLKRLISQKLPDNFFLFWCTVSLGRYQCTVNVLIWLNRPKGIFFGKFFYLEVIFSKSVYNNCFSILS